MTAERKPEEHEVLFDYVRVVIGRWYVILGALALGAAVAGVWAQFMTPIYRATARIIVQEDATTRMLGIPGTYPVDITERYYRTQGQLIRGRGNLTAAAKRLRPRWLKDFEGLGERAIAGVLGARLAVTPVPQSQLLDVSYEGPNKEDVATIANEIVKCFEEQSILRRRSSSETALSWVDERLPALSMKLDQAQRRLQEFQVEHKVISLDREHDEFQRLSQLNSGVTAAEKTRIELEAEHALVAAVGDSADELGALPVVADSPLVRALDLQIIELLKKRTDLLRTVSPGHRDVKAIDEKIADLRKERNDKARIAVSTLGNRLESARAKERVLRTLLAEQEKKALALNEKLINLAGLKQKVEDFKQLRDTLGARSGQLDLASGLNTVPVQVTSWAEEQTSPVKPRRLLIVMVGALIGLLAGVNLAFILERLYARIRSLEELERVSGLRTLGMVPHMSAKEDEKRFLACHFDPKSPVAEAYRAIRTQLLSGAPGPPEGAAPPPRVVMVTSPLDEEGKTTTATNIAAALAQVAERVLLVDADMRRSWAHKPFEMKKATGLSRCLDDGLEPGQAVQRSKVPHLSVIPAGKSPDNPSELLGSPRMAEFIKWAREHYDFVILDAPPVVVVTDPSVIAPVVDAVLLVARSGRTPRRAALHGRQLLESASGNVMGAILNDAPHRPWYYGGYAYGYGYGYYRRYRHYVHDPDDVK